MATPKARKKSESREAELLRAAAKLFKEKGFDDTSVRDIASEVGMLPGSIYYHFPSKDDVLIAVCSMGIENMLAGAKAAQEGMTDPWDRLRAVCTAHILAILGGDDFAAVAVRHVPRSNPELLDQLTAMRDKYEDMFRQLVAELPLHQDVNRKFLRLSLLGSLNYTLYWYNAGGDDPATLVEMILGQYMNGEEVA